MAGRENLGFVLKPSKRARVHHPVAIALKFVTERMRSLRIAPAAHAFDWKSEMGERARIQF